MDRGKAAAAAPVPREVLRLDLLEGAFLRTWAFFVVLPTLFSLGRSAGRECHAIHATEQATLKIAMERIRARLACPDISCREPPDRARNTTTSRTPRRFTLDI